VTRHDYEEIKHDEGASAVIYGIPVGENYDDFTKRVQDFLQSHQESLTHDQMLNILWTGLDATSGSAYRDCLNASVFASGGLHMAVIAATKTEVSVLVNWNPIGREPGTIAPKWTWNSKGVEKLPREITQGMTTVVVPRPTQVHTLALNYPGFTSSIVIEPLSKLPDPPPPLAMVETEEHYTLGELPSGACKDFSTFYTICTPDKPEGWTVVSQSFVLTGNRSCGAYSVCEPVTVTDKKVCWRYQMQGHDEECRMGHGNTGIQYSTGTLTVRWRHREQK
jgi:hypothetical protein